MEEGLLRKIYSILVIILIVVSIDLVINLFSKVSFDGGSKTNNSTTQDESSSYDVSMMNSISLDDLVKLFDNKKDTFVVYLGRANCSACVSFLPTLQDMQNKYEYVTQYLDIRTVDAESSSYEKLMNLLNVEKTITVNGEQKKDAYGNFFGYTPMVFIINKGKFVDGIVGAYSTTEFEKFLNNNGIK